MTSAVAHGRSIIMNGMASNLSVLRMAFIIVGMVARTEAGSVLQAGPDSPSALPPDSPSALHHNTHPLVNALGEEGPTHRDKVEEGPTHRDKVEEGPTLEESVDESLIPRVLVVGGEDHWGDVDDVTSPEEDTNVLKTPGTRPWPKAATRPWPEAIVPYQLVGKRIVQRRVKAVMADLESKTCLRFMARSEEEPYLLVNVGRGNCWTSSIGYPRDKVTINLGMGCRHRARITHELLHALGFLHEHSRPDRDHYVSVNWDNIVKGTKRNFVISRKYSTLEVPYDYQSIMHYGDYAYAVNRSRPTLVRKQGGTGRMGGTHLTHLDILRINTFYRCHLSPPPSS